MEHGNLRVKTPMYLIAWEHDIMNTFLGHALELGKPQFHTCKAGIKEGKSIHHHRGNPPFFLFQGLRYSCYYYYYHYDDFFIIECTLFPCFLRKMVYTIVFFCSVTSGSGDRPRKKGVPRSWCILFFFPGACSMLNHCCNKVGWPLSFWCP